MSPSIMSALSHYQSRYRVLGYPVDLVDKSQAAKIIEEAWQSNKGISVITLNAEMIIAAQNDLKLDRIIRHSHLIIPDGAGVVFALKLAGRRVQRLPGIDLASEVLVKAALLGTKVALIGSKKSVLDSLIEVLPKLYPNLQIAFSHDGYFSEDDEEVLLKDLAQVEPQLVLLALGVPKQEYILDRWRPSLPKAVIMGVGGSFDVWAGEKKRAPLGFQKLHLEWLFRLISEPWRFKRMSSTLPKFAFQVLMDHFRNRE
jgi:N-acetylglucosaminyldiphosphoundecaprenol N-acetyl-beta-D-mannosaminyltransferase